MKLIDIFALEQWINLEKEINQRFQLNASVFETDGIKLTNFKKWANKLCPVVKADKNGQNSQ